MRDERKNPFKKYEAKLRYTVHEEHNHVYSDIILTEYLMIIFHI